MVELISRLEAKSDGLISDAENRLGGDQFLSPAADWISQLINSKNQVESMKIHQTVLPSTAQKLEILTNLLANRL